ncbi:ester cyclase [Streptomyces sp. cmx-4-9]|uniref:nuclear transport factor 2 family protein n=1 Tax=Streptomyces sp. cmx-4-9 TaxID=2790941 RepID=UPI00397F56D5
MRGSPHGYLDAVRADEQEVTRLGATGLRHRPPLPLHPNLRLDIKRVIAEGDMVGTRSHLDLEPGNPDNHGRAPADFFRLENGKVVEHWDVIQDVPTRAANDNGMF